MEEKKILILTIGLPRSGKTTWCLQQGCPVVNPDSIRLALTGQAFFAPIEPLVWAIAKLMVRSLFLYGYPQIILDATNTTIKRRQEWDSKDWQCGYKLFETPASVCIERAKNDQREDLIPVIEKMAAQWESLVALPEPGA